MTELKGRTVRVCSNRILTGIIDEAIDCRGFNALHLQILVSGTTPSAVIRALGSDNQGGNYTRLSDSYASQTVTAETSYDVVVGSDWAKIQIFSIEGTFGSGQGYTIIATPYVSPGQTQVSVEVASYGASAMGAFAQEIQGTAADGDAAVGNPVQIGGVDGAGEAQALRTSTDGRAEVLAQGMAADGAAASGNPVLIAGRDPAGNAQSLAVGTDGLAETRPYSRRDAGALHRNAVGVIDKVAAPAALTSLSDEGTGGNLAFNTTYYFAVAAGNRWGPTTISNTGTPQSQATADDAANTHAIRFTLAQVVGAEWYDIFLSTDAAPKWVARVTEAERANANGVVVSAVGTVAAGSALGAGVIEVQAVGTGIATDNAIFAVNNAYRPAAVAAVGSIDCSGRSRAHLIVKLHVDDLRSAPALTIIPFLANQVSSGDWAQATKEALSVLGAVGQSLIQDFMVEVDGATDLVVLIDAISGQGAECSVWVELV